MRRSEAVAGGGFERASLLEDFDHVWPGMLAGWRRRGRVEGSAGGVDSVEEKGGFLCGGSGE